MSDKEIIKTLEVKLNVKIDHYNTWKENEDEKGPLHIQQLVEFDEFNNVIVLFLNGIGLNKIPHEVFKLKNLKELHVVENSLDEISSKLTKLKNLNTIYAFENNIKKVSEDVIFMDNLKDINLRENPIDNIPVEVVEKGLIDIRNYLISLKGKTKNLNEVKVLLVGDGGSGKTSLQKILTNEKFNSQESQTHGINIKYLKLRPNNKNVTYRMWDFGGQEIMHATHQFFLSRRSIYLVLLNAREEPNPEYWLNHIKSFGGDSPVIVVINKIDENPSFDVNRNFLKNKYPNIIDFVRVSCSENKGVARVKSLLRNAVVEIKNLNVKWAISWFEVKKHLDEMTSNFISYDEFVNLCISQGIHDLSSQNTLVEYLNDLGIILHFKDFALFDTHVLEPEWVTYAVYKIINSKKLATNHGILKIKEVRNIIKTSENDGKFKYPMGQLKYIIELMIKFELCYMVSNEQILIPDLLPVQEPNFEFDKSEDILSVIVSYSFLPKSIMPRLIVNLHGDIMNSLRWRSGLVVFDENFSSTGLIKADYENKQIEISIVGSRRRDYLSVILFILRRINKSFRGIDQKVNIPLENGAKVSYSHLLTLESKGIKRYIPDGMDEEIDVKFLLGNLQNSQSKEEEIFAILDKLVTNSDNKETIAEKANDIIQLQPNIFGFGININALVKKYLKGK